MELEIKLAERLTVRPLGMVRAETLLAFKGDLRAYKSHIARIRVGRLCFITPEFESDAVRPISSKI